MFHAWFKIRMTAFVFLPIMPIVMFCFFPCDLCAVSLISCTTEAEEQVVVEFPKIEYVDWPPRRG